jgi:hypothetical protein
MCGGRSGTRSGSLRVHRFPLPIIPPTAPHSPSSNVCGWYVADVPSGLRLTPPQETKKKKKNKLRSIQRNASYAQNYTETDEHSPIHRAYNASKAFRMYDARIVSKTFKIKIPLM